MNVRRWFSAAVLLLGLGAGARPARADDTPGSLFKRGSAEYRERHFQAAAKLFERAFQLAPTAAAAFNAGLAWDDAHQRAPAANALTRAVNLGKLSDEELAEASRRLALLVPTLGRISVSGPSGVRVRAGDAETLAPGVLYVEPGTVKLEIKRPDGSSESRDFTIGAGENRTLSIESEKKSEPSPPAAPTKPAKPAPPPEPAGAEHPASSTPKILGYVSLGVAAVALGTGAYLNVRGLSANQRFDDSGRTDLAAHDDAVHLRTAAFIGYGVGAAFGIMGTILLVRSGHEAPGETAIELGPARVNCRIRF